MDARTDDGTVPTDHITDEEIRVVLNHYEDPEHPDALTEADVRALLAEFQAHAAAEWPTFTAAVADSRFDAARVTDEFVVFADTSRRAWNRLLDDLAVDDDVARTVLRVVHHQAGRRLADREFDGADAIVVRLEPEVDGGDGIRLVEILLGRLLTEGVTAAEAWAYYGVEIRGYSATEWAERCGESTPMAVADAAETARDVLGR